MEQIRLVVWPSVLFAVNSQVSNSIGLPLYSLSESIYSFGAPLLGSGGYPVLGMGGSGKGIGTAFGAFK
jgi:hypothetical protein